MAQWPGSGSVRGHVWWVPMGWTLSNHAGKDKKPGPDLEGGQGLKGPEKGKVSLSSLDSSW